MTGATASPSSSSSRRKLEPYGMTVLVIGECSAKRDNLFACLRGTVSLYTPHGPAPPPPGGGMPPPITKPPPCGGTPPGGTPCCGGALAALSCNPWRSPTRPFETSTTLSAALPK